MRTQVVAHRLSGLIPKWRRRIEAFMGVHVIHHALLGWVERLRWCLVRPITAVRPQIVEDSLLRGVHRHRLWGAADDWGADHWLRNGPISSERSRGEHQDEAEPPGRSAERLA